MSRLHNLRRALVAEHTGSISVTSGAWVKITYDAPSVNTAEFTESSDVFTCTIPGVYMVQILWHSASTTVANLGIYKNGVLLPLMVLGSSLSSSNDAQDRVEFRGLVELAVGDTVSFYIYPVVNATTQSSTNNLTQLELLS